MFFPVKEIWGLWNTTIHNPLFFTEDFIDSFMSSLTLMVSSMDDGSDFYVPRPSNFSWTSTEVGKRFKLFWMQVLIQNLELPMAP